MATGPFHAARVCNQKSGATVRAAVGWSGQSTIRLRQQWRTCPVAVTWVVGILFCLALTAPGERIARAETVPPETVLVKVNGAEITAADLSFDFYMRQLPEDASAAQRRELTERLVDRLLIEQFLKSRKVEAPTDELERQLELTKKIISLRGGEFEQTLAEVGLNEDQLKRSLALPLAWNVHVARTVTEGQVRDYFADHRRELDGTKRTGSQIVKTIESGADESVWRAAETKLKAIRQDVVAGKLTFADAARQHSDSPAADSGGDLGKFEYTGRLPVEITSIAFSMKPGEMSEVFRTRFGVHLLWITSEIPGQLSAEDVRPQIIKALGDEMWINQVAIERDKSRVIWLAMPD